MDGSERSKKRPRTDAVFDDLVSWIRQLPDSFVHDAVEFRGRNLVVNRHIGENTVMFRIPAIVAPPGLENDYWHPRNDVDLAAHLLDHRDLFRPYWSSLPERIDKDLPRNWSDHDLNRLLKGSPILHRIRDQQEGIQQDYKTSGVKQSFEEFSESLAAVTTRAFQVSETTIGMVPLLDLCDHHRGGTRKNLSYVFEGELCVVRAACEISESETLKITYGAVSNYKLLSDYGFAMHKNVEPDGSSNAIVEFTKSNFTVELRMGPKSYTYGKLISLLEAVSAENMDNHDEKGSVESSLDFDNFVDDESVDLYAEPYSPECLEVDQENNRFELDALQKARRALIDMTQQYVLQKDDSLKKYQGSTNVGERYAALFVLSELQTLHFYVTAIDKLTAKLNGTVEPPEEFVDWDSHDRDRMEQQTEELSRVYMRIRHPQGPLQ